MRKRNHRDCYTYGILEHIKKLFKYSNEFIKFKIQRMYKLVTKHPSLTKWVLGTHDMAD